MQFYYDGRRQLQPLVRQEARTLTGCDRLPISCDSEVWPIRDDSKPIVINFDFQARFEPSLYDQLERLVRVNIVLTTPRFEDNHGRLSTCIRDPMDGFPFGRSSHGSAPSSKVLLLPNGARLSCGAKREYSQTKDYNRKRGAGSFRRLLGTRGRNSSLSILPYHRSPFPHPPLCDNSVANIGIVACELLDNVRR